MSILSNSGFYGFLCSAAKKAGEYVSTFVSGVSGWRIQNSGDAEFKSVYVRDKLVTNEYVYNRIRVTEDEEVLTSNGKIASAAENADGTYTLYLDLREGDLNPFCDGDLLQGYYHSPGNRDVIYSVQKMTVQEDPHAENQSMVVQCEEGSYPHRYMVIVRVGNVFDTDRQSFIKLSSRTNCQYFFDGINSFAALDDPDHVKCVLGKADPGLFPSWAVHAIGGMKKWFGLIADGVILRGHFILQSTNKSMDEEIEEISTRFEVREGEISSRIEETRRYVEEAAQSAGQAARDADRAYEYKETVVTHTNEVINTADKFSQTLSQATEKAVEDAMEGVEKKVESVVSSVVEQTAESWKATILNGQDNIISAINANTEGVSIQGNKITLTGAASFNDNVKIDTMGRIKAVNADISGKITADSGMIGQLTIEEGEIIGKETTEYGKEEVRLKITKKSLNGLAELQQQKTGVDMFEFPSITLAPIQRTISGGSSGNNTQQEKYLVGSFYVRAGCKARYNLRYEVIAESVIGSGSISHTINRLTCYNKQTNEEKPIPDTSSLPVTANFTIDDPGEYEIWLYITMNIYNSPNSTGVCVFQFTYSGKFYFTPQCTVIGSDGLYSYWGPTDYLYLRHTSKGLEVNIKGIINIQDRNGKNLLNSN
ncbi:MAG: hypothetical protein LIP08_02720 [Bacteroides sp.]|nr:hypothetical protein [Bacteroides sp.]